MGEARPFVLTFNPSDIDSVGTIGALMSDAMSVTGSRRFVHARQEEDQRDPNNKNDTWGWKLEPLQANAPCTGYTPTGSDRPASPH